MKKMDIRFQVDMKLKKAMEANMKRMRSGPMEHESDEMSDEDSGMGEKMENHKKRSRGR